MAVTVANQITRSAEQRQAKRAMLSSRAYIFLAVVVASLAVTPHARAAAPLQLGERGQIVVSTAQTLSIAGYSHSASKGSLIYGDDVDEPVYNSTRLVLDFVVMRRFTIGTDVLASLTLGGDVKKKQTSRPSRSSASALTSATSSRQTPSSRSGLALASPTTRSPRRTRQSPPRTASSRSASALFWSSLLFPISA